MHGTCEIYVLEIGISFETFIFIKKIFLILEKTNSIEARYSILDGASFNLYPKSPNNEVQRCTKYFQDPDASGFLQVFC